MVQVAALGHLGEEHGQLGRLRLAARNQGGVMTGGGGFVGVLRGWAGAGLVGRCGKGQAQSRGEESLLHRCFRSVYGRNVRAASAHGPAGRPRR